MRPSRLSRTLAVLCSVGLALPTHTLAADGSQPTGKRQQVDEKVNKPTSSGAADGSSSEAAVINDVALAASGTLSGTVLDRNGHPTAKTKVTITQDGRSVVSAATDKDGHFQVARLRGGVYQVQA